KVIRESAVKKNEDQKLLTYRSPGRDRSWFFSSFSSGKENSGVILKKYRADGTLEWDLSAAKVIFDEKKGWIFDRVIRTPYSRDGLMSKKSEHFAEMTFPLTEISETPEDIFNAIKDEEELSTWVIWNLVSRNPDMAHRVKSIYMTVFYYRLAFPWACFLAVFLGIPLATKNERSGSLLAIIMAVVIIVIYIVLAQIFLVLGKRGVMNPIIAGLAPTVGFIIYGYCKVFFNRA
ncbi:MAG: LptF/LptG family permease, partial [Victivallaceae bacterium]